MSGFEAIFSSVFGVDNVRKDELYQELSNLPPAEMNARCTASLTALAMNWGSEHPMSADPGHMIAVLLAKVQVLQLQYLALLVANPSLALPTATHNDHAMAQMTKAGLSADEVAKHVKVLALVGQIRSDRAFEKRYAPRVDPTETKEE